VSEFAGAAFRQVEGTSPVFGTGGTIWRYQIHVQRGLGIKRTTVQRLVDGTLGDPRGWTRAGTVRFQRTEDGPTLVFVCGPKVVDQLCYPLKTLGEVSCSIENRVVLNSERWKYAVPHWTGSIKSYRQAVLNHEIGHRVGQGHRFCEKEGARHPVMMQFTYGLQGCSCCNSWPLDHEVASL
jgi:Protein of unknown function (DUF3152)